MMPSQPKPDPELEGVLSGMKGRLIYDGGGFNLKKPNITMESRFVFFWVLLGVLGYF